MITSCFSLFLFVGRQLFFTCYFKGAFQVHLWYNLGSILASYLYISAPLQFHFHFSSILSAFWAILNSFFCSFYKAIYKTMIWVLSYGKIEGLAILGITSKWNLRSSEICWKSSGNWIDFLHRLLVDFWLPFQQLWR